MRLASLRDGSRDGRLVVVSADLKTMAPAKEIAPTMQVAIENWDRLGPTLGHLYDDLNAGEVPQAMSAEPREAESPFPRAYQFLDGSAYLNHVELVRKARGAEMPPGLYNDPLMYQAVCDGFLGPRDPITAASEEWGIDFEAEICVVVDDVPRGVSAEDAGGHIKLLMLVNDISLRNLIPGELAKGFGFLQGKPRSAFAPLAVTPESLGEAWDGGKLNLPLRVTLNGREFGAPNAGIDMNFEFPQLIAHAARTRPLAAGTIIGSGTVSNRDASAGFCCLAEIRMIETIEQGAPKTPFLRFGDRLRIEVLDADGRTLFGTIEQEVKPA
jgi:fumarylacetoacetate (FAA) hydrolase